MLGRKKLYTREEVLETVRKLIKSVMKSYEKQELNCTADEFFEEIDSLRIIELVVLTEKKFKINFSPEQLSSLSEKKLETFVDAIVESLEGINKNV